MSLQIDKVFPMKLRHTSLILTLSLTLGGCASAPGAAPTDPLENYNRQMFAFNDRVDKAIATPLAQGYVATVPAPARQLVNNFFSNLDDFIVTGNDLLQLKFRQACSDGARFLFNSTFGLAGLLNVTSRLEKHDEDFGQTLGYWGIAPGPYVVLPFLGPSTVRDSFGMLGDSGYSQIVQVGHVPSRNMLYLLKGVHRRAQLFDKERMLDGVVLDRYGFLRDAYLQRRQSLVYDGNPPRAKYDLDDDEEDLKDAPIPSFPVSRAPLPAQLLNLASSLQP